MKSLRWIGKSLNDLKLMPEKVKDEVGFALHEAQRGNKGLGVKPLKGFMGAGVLEVISSHDGDTYRAVYVLHVFQKKSKRGIATPKLEMELIKQRLKEAQRHYEGSK